MANMAYHSLAWWRSIGSLTPTRYEGLFIFRQDTNLWRTLLQNDGGDADVTGPPYATKTEALSVLDAVAETWDVPLKGERRDATLAGTG